MTPRGLGGAVLAVAIGTAPAARAEPPRRVALVIGETEYAAMPPLPVCAGSARAVAGVLRQMGYSVTQRLDSSNGETDAALGDFRKALAAGEASAGVLYVCGYAGGLNDRSFLLPVEAAIERPFDLITQGVVANSLLSALAPAGAGLLALDLFPRPGQSGKLPMTTLMQSLPAERDGVVAVAETDPNDAASPLASALVDALSAPTVRTSRAVEAVQRRVPTVPGSKVLLAEAATGPGFLLGGPPPAERPKPRVAAAPPAPKPEPAPAPAPAPAPVGKPAAAVAPSPPLPGEAQMTVSDRRRVQAALAVLGYYSGRIDGQFGPETRAAIRRFQHEIGAGTTGFLTGAEATRLVAPGGPR